jgi:hypothetical protein
MDRHLGQVPPALRWVTVPVASIVTFPVVYVAGFIISRLLSFFTVPTFLSDNFFDYIVCPGVAGFYSVHIAGILAPSAKKATELTIAALWTMIYGFVATLTFLLGAWPVALAMIPSFIGARMAVLDEQL